LDPHVFRWQDIGTREIEHEHHVDGPATNSLHFDELFDDGFVFHGRESVEVDFVSERSLGEIEKIARLLATDTEGSKGFGGMTGKRLGRESITATQTLARALRDGGRRLAAQLLAHDAAGEAMEAHFIGAEGEFSEAVDERSEFGIGVAEKLIGIGFWHVGDG